MNEQKRIEELEKELELLRNRLALPEGDPSLSPQQAQEAQQAALDRLLGDRVVLANLPDIVTVLDRDHRILYLNRPVPGRNVADTIGTDALAYIPPADLDRYRETFERAWTTGEPQGMELKTIGGFWWQTRFVPVKEDGKVMLILGTSTDVTQGKRSERALRDSETRLRHAISASGMGAWTWDRRDDKIVWDQTLCDIFGISLHEAPVDYEAYLAMIHPEDRARVGAALGHYLATGIYEDLEHRLIRPSGEVRHVLAKGTTILDEQGQAVGFRGGVFDVTTRVRLEAQLHQAQKMEAIGQLTAGIAHNFNNALSVIIHNAALCRDGADAETAEQLSEIEDAGMRAAEMVRQLMIFARPDSRARKTSIDLVRSARRTLEMCQRTMDRCIRLELETNGDIPAVYANAGQIDQVLLNICLNARDAIEEAHTSAPCILIRVEAAGSKAVRVRISDNGPGMTDEVRSRIFEPFFTTKEVGRGTGLGLAMVYSVIADHRGRIDCESRPGQGTSFEIVLPAAEQIELGDSTHGATPRLGGTETILLIDDETPVRRALREILQRDGYTVLEASDGPTGIALFERERRRIDLIVLDRSMPGLPGDVVLQQLNGIDASVPIVLLSGHPGAGDNGGRSSAVLTKPTDRATLLRTMRSVLDRG